MIRYHYDFRMRAIDDTVGVHGSSIGPEIPPMSEATKERSAFAEWLARQHLRFDSRLTQVIHLPAGAPDDEVRLVEVNTGLYPEPGSPIISVETTPAISNLPFRVSVADVTPEEWNRIQTDPQLLPTGWGLEGNQITKRAR